MHLKLYSLHVHVCVMCVGMGLSMVYWLSEILNSTTGQNGDLHFNFRSEIKSQGQIQVYFAGWLGEARGV